MTAPRTVWAALLLAVAVTQPARSLDGALPLLLAAGVLPVVAVSLARRRATVVAALIVVAALFGGWLALRGSGTGSLDDLTGALPRLLTAPRPAPATAAYLALPVVATVLVATLAGLSVAAQRALGPVLAAAVVYAAGALLSAGRADPHGLVAAAVLAVAVLGWSLPMVRPTTALATVAVLGVGLLVAALVPSGHAFEPRRHVTPPGIQLDEQNPLSFLASWGRNPDAEILRTRITGTDRLHLATLSDFTGDSWHADEVFRPIGAVVTPDLPAGRVRGDVGASVTITRLSGPWLPAPGDAAQVSLPGVVTDVDSGSLARAVDVNPGVSYTVRGADDAPVSGTLESAGVPDSPERYLAVPDLPSAFAAYASQSVRGASTALEQAIAIEHAVSSNRTLAPTAPSGSSYARLSTFLFGAVGQSGSQAGTSEQFAASFAVLARAVGLPTRLVVGFIVRPGTDPGGESSVVGRDALAWPEIYFSGAGWVPFDPTPGNATATGDAPLRQKVLNRLDKQAKAVPLPTVKPSAPLPRPPAAAVPIAQPARADGGSVLLPAVLILVGVLVLLVLLLLGLRIARRMRHRRRGPLGAWSEVMDLLVLLDRRPPPSHPAGRVAQALELAVAAAPGTAVLVADGAERAAFARPQTAVDEDVLWRQVRVLRRAARSSLPWYRRVLAPIDPRPLRSARGGRRSADAPRRRQTLPGGRHR